MVKWIIHLSKADISGLWMRCSFYLNNFLSYEIVMYCKFISYLNYWSRIRRKIRYTVFTNSAETFLWWIERSTIWFTCSCCEFKQEQINNNCIPRAMLDFTMSTTNAQSNVVLCVQIKWIRLDTLVANFSDVKWRENVLYVFPKLSKTVLRKSEKILHTSNWLFQSNIELHTFFSSKWRTWRNTLALRYDNHAHIFGLKKRI